MDQDYLDLVQEIKSLEEEMKISEVVLSKTQELIDNALESYLTADKEKREKIAGCINKVLECQGKVEKMDAKCKENLEEAIKIKREIEEDYGDGGHGYD